VTRAGLLAALAAVSALAFVPTAAAQTVDPPCPAGTPAPKFTVNGKATGALYTTQALTVRVKLPGDPDAYAESFVVTGVRLLAEQEGGDEVNAMADSPGTLSANAVMRSYRGPDGDPCTVPGSASFEVRAATSPVVSKLRRPRPFPADPPLLRDTDFSFTVKPGPTGNRNPLTVEARAVLRARLPGKGVKAKTKVVGLRAEDIVEDRGRTGACSVTTLICPPHVRSWSKGPEVYVFDVGRGGVPNGLEVRLTAPRGVPGRGSFPGRTPFGVDVKVLQSGRTIARLRVAGECRPFGQFSKCRYKKLTTRVG
jgi:hypothetical protein